MPIPVRQAVRVGTYVFKNKLRRREKFPLIVELEPLFACNLECPGCGKIQYPTEVLRKRVSVDEAVGAMEECGAPMVSIAGGEPLLHPQIGEMVAELIKRKRFVYLCTNAVLLRRKIHLFEPSPYFSFVVHVDGLQERHDLAVARDGVFDELVEAVGEAKDKGFRVTTNSTFFSTDSPDDVRSVLDFLNDDLEVDSMMISPGYAYEKAPDQEHFLPVEQTKRLFRDAFSDGKRKKWRLNHTPLFLDFLEGKVEYECTAWGDPQLFGVRLAEALLPHGRRIHRDLPGADRDHRLGQLWPGERSPLRELHGPLRIRAHRGARHYGVAERVHPGRRRHELAQGVHHPGPEAHVHIEPL